MSEAGGGGGGWNSKKGEREWRRKREKMEKGERENGPPDDQCAGIECALVRINLIFYTY